MSRVYYPICVGLYSIISFSVAVINLVFGSYFYGIFFSTTSLMETLCAYESGFHNVTEVADYQRIAYDWYVLVDLYVDLYLCTGVCNCISRVYLDESLWGDRAVNLNNYEFFGSYSNFQQCYVDLRDAGKIEAISTNLLAYVIESEDIRDCQGLCSPSPMFHFYKNITEGPPQTNCADFLVNELSWGYLLYGSFFLFCGLMLLLSFNI
mmetsp:Transcript_18468/g.17578  ORF Transcript_18468/g.17578 Transcript_18468/m.17578 type:complete len:208 (+) Transcript_18468:253-876(+)